MSDDLDDLESMEESPPIWKRIVKRLNELEMKPSQLAKEIGIQQSALTHLANGTTKAPKAVNLFPMAQVLRMDPQELLYGERRYFKAEEYKPSQHDVERGRTSFLSDRERRVLDRIEGVFVDEYGPQHQKK